MFFSVYKKRGKRMSNLEKVQKYIEEHCKSCDKKIDCKIIEKINGQLQCIED